MKGWVVVTPQGYADEIDLTAWVQKGMTFAGSLPSK